MASTWMGRYGARVVLRLLSTGPRESRVGSRGLLSGSSGWPEPSDGPIVEAVAPSFWKEAHRGVRDGVVDEHSHPVLHIVLCYLGVFTFRLVAR